MQVRITTAVTIGETKKQRCTYQDIESDQDITELLWTVRQFLRSQLKKESQQPLKDNLGLEAGENENEEIADNGEIE